jgi:AmmeMemoRadiSam system protein B
MLRKMRSTPIHFKLKGDAPMPRHTPTHERPPAVAGMFYPADAAELRRDVDEMLAAGQSEPPAPKAIVVPHAGYIYSGTIAAAAYAQLRSEAERIRNVVLVGPSHRVAFRGLAAPTVDAFVTPLGAVPIDAAARAVALSQSTVIASDEPHRLEHSLEVQLPFLQSVLGDFTLLPLVAGNASPNDVADVLDCVWGEANTLIVISTDLSHYLSYEAAERRDTETCRRITAFEGELRGDDACGCVGVNGFLLAARRRQLQPRLIARGNSGDTAGDRRRVVGYAAFAFHEI